MMKKRVTIVLSAIASLAALWAIGSVVWGNPYVAKGRQLYNYYCAGCHGAHGRQNEGYNWGHMPDPRPKDLSAKVEMSTLKDEEIFATISRDMKDTTPEVGDKIGDDEFAVPTMPTFKYTLSEEEIWAIVAYVRTLHGMKLQVDVAAQKKALEDALQKAQQAYEQSRQVAEATAQPVANAGAAAEPAGQDAQSPEEVALKQAQLALANFTARPKPAPLPRPDLTVSEEAAAKQAELAKRLYMNKYGCNGCHRIGEEGGIVGPALDRAGFRLNPTWVYRWIRYPQSMKPDTRMPNLGISDPDAKAIAMYLATLRAPRPDKPIERASN
ncbi:MAG: c-type cytochrome [Nitrospirae bacterium]|nr:c-type cytochrome [Nitrospirota bacterium]